jgi:hypothetical protein
MRFLALALFGGYPFEEFYARRGVTRQLLRLRRASFLDFIVDYFWQECHCVIF